MSQKFLDRNLDLAVAFIGITVLGVAYGSFGSGRLQDALQFADRALNSERALLSSLCEPADNQMKGTYLHDIVSFQRDPAILTSLTGNSAKVRLRQHRPHRAEYHPRRIDFKPRVILVDFSLDDGGWCTREIEEQS